MNPSVSPRRADASAEAGRILPRWIWVVYLVLFAGSVPWYVPAGPLRIWFGLPHWVVVSIAAVGGVALFTVFVVRRYWPDDEDEAAGEG